jgi:hypothetical protein
MVHVFDVGTGQLVRTLTDPAPNHPVLVDDAKFGASILSSNGSFFVGAPGDANLLGTVYIVDAASATIVGGFQRPKGRPRFGATVAARGAETFVGDPGDLEYYPASGITASGRVYRFINDQPVDTWSNPTGADGDEFGAAIASNEQRILVGAPGANDGRGMVFAGSQFGVVDHALSVPNGAVRDGFGTAVALDRDVALVGAPYTDVPLENAGRVFIFDGTGGLTGEIQSPQPEAGAFFGVALATNGGRVLVGAPFDDSRRGRVHLADIIREKVTTSFVPPNHQPGTLFGVSVAWVGDRVLVGAPLEDVVQGGLTITNAGAAFLYDAATGALVQSFHAPIARTRAEFGSSVSSIDGDVLIGAPLDETDPTTIDTGTIYRFHTTGELVGRYESLVPSSREQFGFAVGAIGTKVLAGAPGGRAAYVLTAPNGQANAATTAAITAQAPDSPPPCLGGYCNDHDPCTRDTCDVGAGGCAFVAIPGCGCATDLDCSDHKSCTGFERCRTCNGCFLHDWPCCGNGGQCERGTSAVDGTPCNDDDACNGEGACEGGACVCAPEMQPRVNCSECHDGDPCTYDQCSPADGCRYVPVSGALATSCAFDRSFPGDACTGQSVPPSYSRAFARAQQKVLQAQSGSDRRRRRLYGKARRILTKRLVALRRKRAGRLTTECRDSLEGLLGDAQARVESALAAFAASRR